MSGTRELYELQEIDAQIDARRKRIAQINREIEGNRDLLTAKTELQKRQALALELSTKQKAAEEEASANQARIAMLEGRMYGGQAGAAKELQSMTKEVAHLKERQGTLDTATLEAMEAASPAQAAVAQQTTAVRTADAAWEGQRVRLAGERTSLEAEIAQWQQRRAQCVSGIPPASLTIYDRLRAAKGNIAVAKVERGVCGGCRITISTMLVLRAKAGKEFVHCSNCGRILFAV